MKRKIEKTAQSACLNRIGFSLIEVILALGIFLVTVLALVGLIGPTLKSVDEVKKANEVGSVVNTVNAFLQSSSKIATSTDSRFNAIFKAVADGGEATLFVYRRYIDASSADTELTVGFAAGELVGSQAQLAAADFDYPAGDIYRVVLTPSSVNPDTMVTDLGDVEYPRYKLSVATADLFTEGAFAMEVRIFAEEPSASDIMSIPLASLTPEEAIFTYNTAIVR